MKTKVDIEKYDDITLGVTDEEMDAFLDESEKKIREMKEIKVVTDNEN